MTRFTKELVTRVNNAIDRKYTIAEFREAIPELHSLFTEINAIIEQAKKDLEGVEVNEINDLTEDQIDMMKAILLGKAATDALTEQAKEILKVILSHALGEILGNIEADEKLSDITPVDPADWITGNPSEAWVLN